MAGGGDVALGAVWVVDGVHAGGDGVPQSRGDLVQVLENLGGVEVEVGEGTGGGTQAAHGGGSADAAAHDVAHNECGLVAIERQDVVPVAADLECGLCGPVPGGNLQAGKAGRVFGRRLRCKVSAALRTLWCEQALSMHMAVREASSPARARSSSSNGSGLRARVRPRKPRIWPRAVSGTAM